MAVEKNEASDLAAGCAASVRVSPQRRSLSRLKGSSVEFFWL